MVTDVAVVGRTPGADDVPAPARPKVHRLSRAAVALVSTVCVAMVGASILIADNEARADTRFDQVHRSLDATRHQIALARADLATVRGDLDTVDGQLDQDAGALSQDTTQLQGLESALTSARSDISSQTSAIGDLKTCLGGVEQALNSLSVGDQPHAIDALDVVAASCKRAVTADG